MASGSKISLSNQQNIGCKITQEKWTVVPFKIARNFPKSVAREYLGLQSSVIHDTRSKISLLNCQNIGC
jgi:hypothetical protein